MASDQACRSKHYEVRPEDLPVCCPMPDKRIWDGHPRVYLPVERTGHSVCPYCEAEYTLVKKHG